MIAYAVFSCPAFESYNVGLLNTAAVYVDRCEGAFIKQQRQNKLEAAPYCDSNCMKYKL